MTAHSSWYDRVYLSKDDKRGWYLPDDFYIITYKQVKHFIYHFIITYVNKTFRIPYFYTVIFSKLSIKIKTFPNLRVIHRSHYYLIDKPLKDESESPTFIRTNLLELSVRPTITLTAELTAYEYRYFIILLMSFVDLQI